MPTAAGLPLPRLSRGRFPYAFAADEGEGREGHLYAYTDEDLFDACGVRVAFTERSGGFSLGAFASLNLGSDGDDDDVIRLNRTALVHAMGAESTPERLVCPVQVHGDGIAWVEDSGPSYEQALAEALEGRDAVLVTCQDVGALLRFADCLPLILVAPGGAFSVVHCGWRGAAAHLAAKAARALVERAACSPQALNAYIGPYIHSECFEVGLETAEHFVREFGEDVVNALEGQGRPHYYVNLAASVSLDLRTVGLDGERIVDCDICTVCNNDRFFSFRAQDGVCGRHGAYAICLSSN